jgi:hypothetical protein
MECRLKTVGIKRHWSQHSGRDWVAHCTQTIRVRTESQSAATPRTAWSGINRARRVSCETLSSVGQRPVAPCSRHKKRSGQPRFPTDANQCRRGCAGGERAAGGTCGRPDDGSVARSDFAARLAGVDTFPYQYDVRSYAPGGWGKRAAATIGAGLTVQRLTRAARAYVATAERHAACQHLAFEARDAGGVTPLKYR